MNEINLNVDGIECMGCEKRIQNAISNISGVEKVIANHKDGTVKVKANKDLEKEIKEKINNLGFEVIE